MLSVCNSSIDEESYRKMEAIFDRAMSPGNAREAQPRALLKGKNKVGKPHKE